MMPSSSDQPSRRRAARLIGVIGAGLLALAPTVVGAQSPSILDPASPNASELATLYRLIFFLGVGVFLLVEGLIIYAVFRFRRKEGETALPAQVHGSTQAEIAWTIAPTIIVLVLAALSYRTLWASYRGPAVGETPGAETSAEVIEVDVIGHQWWWEFRYDDPSTDAPFDFATTTELYVPVGRPVMLYLNSADVIHSFWVPQVAHKVDAIPGERDGGYRRDGEVVSNRLWFVADREGRYWGHCAELCGTQHSGMRMNVVAVPEAEYEAWLERMRQPAPRPAEGSQAARGYELIQTVGCQGCHRIDGMDGMVGQLGPNLTHVASRTHLAGGVFENTPDNLRQWLKTPDALKPGSKMTALGLDDDEVDAIATFLETLE